MTNTDGFATESILVKLGALFFYGVNLELGRFTEKIYSFLAGHFCFINNLFLKRIEPNISTLLWPPN